MKKNSITNYFFKKDRNKRKFSEINDHQSLASEANSEITLKKLKPNGDSLNEDSEEDRTIVNNDKDDSSNQIVHINEEKEKEISEISSSEESKDIENLQSRNATNESDNATNESDNATNESDNATNESNNTCQDKTSKSKDSKKDSKSSFLSTYVDCSNSPFRDWIIYDKEKDALFCKLCIKAMEKSKNIWVNQ
jgi:hypothetical protein